MINWLILSIIIALALFVLCIWLFSKSNSDSEDDFGFVLASPFIGFVICVIITHCIYRNADYTSYTYTKTPIVSIERESAVTGRFILGSGFIDTKPVYYFYERVGENEYHLRDVSARSIRIQESDEEPFYMDKTPTYEGNGLIRFLNGKWLFPDKEHIYISNGDYIEDVISVPKNTIIRKFELK